MINSRAKAEALRPVVRWAGGKSAMVRKLASLMPLRWKRYIEPMPGGAALFFYLRPPPAILADVNSDLMTFYSALRNRPAELIRRLRSLRASREQYYSVRASRPRGEIQRAVRFAYLNRLAWNGLFRVNRRGEFNVPIGDRLPSVMWNETDLLNASAALTTAQLITADFRATAGRAAPGDFVFFDPPYPRGCREHVGFNRYASEFFTVADHHDLARIIHDMTQRSIRVMLTDSANVVFCWRLSMAVRTTAYRFSGTQVGVGDHFSTAAPSEPVDSGQSNQGNFSSSVRVRTMIGTKSRPPVNKRHQFAAAREFARTHKTMES